MTEQQITKVDRFEDQKIYASYAKRAAIGLVKGTIDSAKRELDMLRPRWLWVATTELCNSRCTYCNIWMNKKTFEPLSPDEIFKTLSDPVFKDVSYIINSGGESTVRQDLTEFFLAEHRALPKARINLSTNALMPDRAYNTTKACLDAGITFDVGISLDGLGEKHDIMRGVKGNFEKVVDLVTRLKELQKQYIGDDGQSKLSITLGSVLIDETVVNLEELKVWAEKINVPLQPQWYNNSSYYNNTGTEKEHQRAEIERVVANLPKNVLTEAWQKWLRHESIQFKCFSLFDFCVLQSDGNIAPCLTHWGVSAGNVRKNTPTEIWSENNPQMHEARKIVRACSGCLNTWSYGWSAKTEFFPIFSYYIRNPDALKVKMELEKRYKNFHNSFDDPDIASG